jgi:hypothetical protein
MLNALKRLGQAVSGLLLGWQFLKPAYPPCHLITKAMVAYIDMLSAWVVFGVLCQAYNAGVVFENDGR